MCRALSEAILDFSFFLLPLQSHPEYCGPCTDHCTLVQVEAGGQTEHMAHSKKSTARGMLQIRTGFRIARRRLLAHLAHNNTSFQRSSIPHQSCIIDANSENQPCRQLPRPSRNRSDFSPASVASNARSSATATTPASTAHELESKPNVHQHLSQVVNESAGSQNDTYWTGSDNTRSFSASTAFHSSRCIHRLATEQLLRSAMIRTLQRRQYSLLQTRLLVASISGKL